MAVPKITPDKYLISASRVECRACGYGVNVSLARNKKEREEQNYKLIKLAGHYCLPQSETIGAPPSKPVARPDGNKCRACPQLMQWAVQNPTEANPDPRPNPLDILPNPKGNIRLDKKTMRYDVLTGEELRAAQEAGEELFLSHFATCPNRGKFRKQ